jgi:hypothetical protein
MHRAPLDRQVQRRIQETVAARAACITRRLLRRHASLPDDALQRVRAVVEVDFVCLLFSTSHNGLMCVYLYFEYSSALMHGTNVQDVRSGMYAHVYEIMAIICE